MTTMHGYLLAEQIRTFDETTFDFAVAGALPGYVMTLLFMSGHVR